MANTKITTNVIADDAVTTAKIADNAITAAKIASGAVVADIANDSIDSQHYVAASIDNEHLADNAVDSAELAAGSVDLAHMSVNSIDSDQYVDGSIDTAHIADDQITLAKMAGLARGKIIIGDSSGDPVALALGTSGYVLKSDGNDIAWAADAGLSTEEVQDIAGAMFSSNTETGITATYQDGDGTIDLVVGTLNQDTTGTAATVTTAAQTNITSVGTLTGLTGGTGDLIWDSPTFVVDSSANKVGIGTASPTSLLYLADTANITITLDPTTGDADAWTINAVDDGGTGAFDIRNVDTSERPFIIKEGGNVLMNVGNVGIGAASPAAKLDIATAGSTARPLAIRITNAASTNYAWEIWRDNTTGDFKFGEELAGTETTRVNFQSGGGISFGTDTAAANALDDYEEGTWGPSISNFTGTQTSFSHDCTYTKIGRMIYFNAKITSNGGTTTWGTSCLIGLPITGVSNSGGAWWQMPAERNTTAAAEHMVPIDMSDLGNARFFIQNGFEQLESGEYFVISGFYRAA